MKKETKVTRKHPGLTPHETVLGVLASSNLEDFNADQAIIHSAFAELKEMFPLLFHAFIFSQGNNYPYSRLLEETFFELGQSSVLRMKVELPSKGKYTISAKMKADILRNLKAQYPKKKFPQLWRELRSAGEEFASLCPAELGI